MVNNLRRCFLYFAVLILFFGAFKAGFSFSILDKALEYHYAVEYALPMMGADMYFSRFYPRIIHDFGGKDVKVAIIDSGIDEKHPWFENITFIYKGSTYYSISNESCIYYSNSYQDYSGHGTHIAGILTSTAPNASYIIIKPLYLGERDILCALKKAIELDADIVSMSLGRFSLYTDGYDDMLYSFVENYSNQTLFVFSAGNDASESQHYNFSTNTSFLMHNAIGAFALFFRYYNKSLNFTIEAVNASDNFVWFAVNVENNIPNLTYVCDQLSPDNISLLYNCSPTQCYVALGMDYFTYDLLFRTNLSHNADIDVYDLYYYAFKYFYNPLEPSTSFSTITSPATAPHAIAVGSFISHIYEDEAFGSRKVGDVSAFSSQGPLRHNYSLIKPDLIAPGEQINSSESFGDTVVYSGTSMSAPFVAGIAAIIKSIFINATPNEIKNYLFYLADPSSYNLSAYTIWEKGRGLLNLTFLYPSLKMHYYSCPKNITSPLFSCIVNLTNTGLTPYFGVGFKENANVSIQASHKCIDVGLCDYTFSLPGHYKPDDILVSASSNAFSNISKKLVFYVLNQSYLLVELNLTNYGFRDNITVVFNSSQGNYVQNRTVPYASDIAYFYILNLSNISSLNVFSYYDVGDPLNYTFSSQNSFNITWNFSYTGTSILDNFTLNLNESFPYEIPLYKSLNNYSFSSTNLSIPFYKIVNDFNSSIALSYHFTYFNTTYALFSTALTLPYAQINFSNIPRILSPYVPIELCYFLNHSKVDHTLVLNLSYGDLYAYKKITINENNSCFNITLPFLPVENKTLILRLFTYAGSFMLAQNTTAIFYDGLPPRIYFNVSNYTITHHTNYSVKVKIDDANSIVNASFYDGNASFNLSYVVYANLSYGFNELNVLARDALGNTANASVVLFVYNKSFSFSKISAYVSNVSAWIINKEGFNNINGTYFINFTPLAPVEVVLNFTLDDNEILKGAYKLNDDGSFEIPFHINGTNYCTIYLNASSDPEVGVFVDLINTETSSSSSSGSVSSSSGGSFYTLSFSSSDEKSEMNITSNESGTSSNDVTNPPSSFNEEFDVATKKNTASNLNNTSLPSPPSPTLFSKILFVLFMVFVLLLLIFVIHRLRVRNSKESSFLLSAYDVLGAISNEIYENVKQNYKCKTYKNPEKGIKEIVYVLQGDKGWDKMILIKREDGHIIVARPHKPIA